MLILYMSIYFQQITKCITTMEALKHSSKTASYVQSCWFNQLFMKCLTMHEDMPMRGHLQ